MIALFAGLYRAASRPLLAPDPAPAEPVEGEIAQPAEAATVDEIDGGERHAANDAGQPLTLGRPAGSGTASA